MRLIKILVLTLILVLSVHAKEDVLNISFKNLSIMDLIDITSKVIDRNILITQNIPGNVDFISNKPLYKKDVVNILMYVLETKGYTLVDNENILRIVRLNESTKYSAPIIYGQTKSQYFQMVTEVFHVYNSNVDYVASKVRHLISKSAKLITDKESNIIMITDYKRNIDSIKHLIRLITQDKRKMIEVVELQNIQSNDAKTTLSNVAKSVFNFAVEKDKVEILENKENNAITLVGSKKNVQYLKNYILNIDQKGNLTQRTVEVISLKNVESKNVIKIISNIIDKKQYLDNNNKPHASSDDESNSIVLMGPKDEIAYIKTLIHELDKDKLQVYVEAKIIEVSENRTRDVGLKYGLNATEINSGGIFTLGASLGGELSSTASGYIANQITAGTLSSGIALSATLNLLKNNQAIDVVSEPSILCINNKESSIYVGETKSFQTGQTSNENGTSEAYTREDIGLTLKVKPRISNKNKVTLEIETILEDAKEITKLGQVNPDTTKKEVKTSAIVLNGESVILGGLIRNKVDVTKDKVPFFGDIPLLGNLFKNDRTVKDKINLVIIVTPYIIPKSKNLSYVRNELAQLSLLEEKYMKDLELKLEQKRLKDEQDDFKREKKFEKLENKKEDFYEEKEEYYEQHESSKSKSGLSLHEQRVKEIFGQ